MYTVRIALSKAVTKNPHPTSKNDRSYAAKKSLAGKCGCAKICFLDTIVHNCTTRAACNGEISVGTHDVNGELLLHSGRGGELVFVAPGDLTSTWSNSKYRRVRSVGAGAALITALAVLFVEARRGNGSSIMQGLLEYKNYEPRNNYEIRELLRIYSENPQRHSTQNGFGRFKGVFEYHSSSN